MVLEALQQHVREQLKSPEPDHHSFPLDPDVFEYLYKKAPSASVQAFLAETRARVAPHLGVGVYRWTENHHEVVVFDTDGDHGFVAVFTPSGEPAGFGRFVVGETVWLTREAWFAAARSGE